MPARVAGRRFSSSRYFTSKRRPVRDDPGNIISIASSTRYSTPVGPAMTSGWVRRRNWASRIRNGRPPKWSPCRWVSSTASSASGSTPWRFMASMDVAPQSSSTRLVPASRRMHVWWRPPLPNASPEPRKVTRTRSGARDGGDGVAEDLHGLVNLLALDDERRSEHDQVAGAVDLAARGVHDRAALQRLGLDLLGHARRGGVRLAARRIANDLDGGHEPDPAHIAHGRKIGEAAQSHHQVLAHDSGAGDEVVALEVTHHGQAGSGHDRMVAVSEAVMKAAAGVHGLDDTSACHHGSAWYVATGQALAGREDVGPHARPVLHAEPSSGAAHARHHLDGDEEHAVAVARLSHEPVILGRWNDRSCRGADGRLRDEGGHRVGAFFTDLCVQSLRALE